MATERARSSRPACLADKILDGRPPARLGMMGRALTGCIALVTEASRRAGIGYAIARRLLDDGAQVMLHSWTPHDAARPWGATRWNLLWFTSGQHLGSMRGELPYIATKGALHQLTASLVDALADRQITVLTCPVLGSLSVPASQAPTAAISAGAAQRPLGKERAN